MASISSLISFIVLLLAAYSYSAPVVSDLQATTSISKVENVTIDFQVQDLVILVRDGNSTAPQYKRPSATVGSSSSSSSEEDHTRQTEQTTDELSTRASKFTSVPLSTETNPKREVDAEVNDSFADADDKREVDADTNDKREVDADTNDKREVDADTNDKREVDADTNDKREVDAEANDSFADADDKREVDADANESFAESDEKRAVTDDSLSTKTITKHGIAVQSVDSSTVADQTSTVEGTSDPSTSKMIHHKRAFDGSQWLSADSDAQMKKRALDGSQWLSADSDAQMKKRALDGSQWLSADSDAQMNKRAFDGSQWLSADVDAEANKRSVDPIESSTNVDETSTSKVIHHKRAFDGSQWLSADVDAEANKRSVESMDESSGESSENFNERAIQSSSVMTNPKREMDQSSSLSDDSSEAFNRRAIGSVESGDLTTVVAVKIQSKSTTDEQLSSSTVEPVSSTGIIPDQSSSTSESETTVASPVSSGTTAKILAIIPGKLSKPQYVIQPVSEAPVVAEHMQLSQGQNQTITETKKPNY